MLNYLKRIANRIVNRIKYPNKYNSEAFIKYCKKNGCKIGKGTYFFSPTTTYIDIKNAIFITIGEYCKITSGVKILAHDFSYSVLRRVYHSIPKKTRMTTIGDNVFIGINSIILSGSDIGNNVIIGAGSVVSGKIPDNEVWGGNPAKFICSLDEYYKKCQSFFENGAVLTVKQYKERLNRLPSINEMHFFSTLFLPNNTDSMEKYAKMPFNGDEKEEVLEDLSKNKNKYESFNDFLKSNNLM